MVIIAEILSDSDSNHTAVNDAGQAEVCSDSVQATGEGKSTNPNFNSMDAGVDDVDDGSAIWAPSGLDIVVYVPAMAEPVSEFEQRVKDAVIDEEVVLKEKNVREASMGVMDDESKVPAKESEVSGSGVPRSVGVKETPAVGESSTPMAKIDQVLKDLEEMRNIAIGQQSAPTVEPDSVEEEVAVETPGVVVLNSDDEDNVPLAQKFKRKAPESGPRALALRSGSRGRVSEKVAEHSTGPSKRRKIVKVAEAASPSRIIMDEYSIDEKFMMQHKLDDIFEMIKKQKWHKILVQEDDKVDKDLVMEFYKRVRTEVKGSVVTLIFEIKGEEHCITNRELGMMLGLDDEGFEVFVKRQWPEGTSDEEKEEVELRVCGYADAKVNDLHTSKMEPKIKILHRILVQSILPRGSKQSIAQIQDILVLDHMMRMEKINWPKMILYQMEHTSKSKEVGYARFVKRILKLAKAYNPNKETPVVQPLTLYSIHRLQIKFDKKTKVWVRKVESPVVEEIPEVAEEVGEASDTRIVSLEKGLDEVRKTLGSLEKDVKDTLRGIKKDIRDLKKVVEDGFSKLLKD